MNNCPKRASAPFHPLNGRRRSATCCLPAEFRELQRELHASAPFSWRSLLLTVPALAAMCAAMYLFFPHSRFAAPKETPIAIAEEKPLPDSDRKLLRRARELHNHGKIREALTLLAPAVRRVLESSDPVQAENAQALLAQFWEWRMPVAPVRVAAECRRILGCSPDHLVAKLTLARLQPQSFPALAGLQEKAPQLLREMSEERLAMLRPLLGASAVTADQQSEIAWQYALAATGCWLAAGAAAFPDEPGFARAGSGSGPVPFPAGQPPVRPAALRYSLPDLVGQMVLLELPDRRRPPHAPPRSQARNRRP